MDLKPKPVLHAVGLGSHHQEHLGNEQGGTEEQAEFFPLFVLKGNQKSRADLPFLSGISWIEACAMQHTSMGNARHPTFMCVLN